MLLNNILKSLTVIVKRIVIQVYENLIFEKTDIFGGGVRPMGLHLSQAYFSAGSMTWVIVLQSWTLYFGPKGFFPFP